LTAARIQQSVHKQGIRTQQGGLETFHYGIRIDHDGRKYDVEIPDFTAPKCSNCGELSIDEAASQQIDSAFRRQASLLTAAEIREGRLGLGLKQEDFAEQLGLAVATVSRSVREK